MGMGMGMHRQPQLRQPAMETCRCQLHTRSIMHLVHKCTTYTSAPGLATDAAACVLCGSQVRRWDSPLLPVCLAVPVLGPAAYLVLRPSVE